MTTLPKPPNWIDPPSLQKLVEHHGGWNLIPEEAWHEFNARMATWKAIVAGGELHKS